MVISFLGSIRYYRYTCNELRLWFCFAVRTWSEVVPHASCIANEKCDGAFVELFSHLMDKCSFLLYLGCGGGDRQGDSLQGGVSLC